MNIKLSNKLIKTLLIFLGYIFYTNIFGSIFSIVGLENTVESIFASDILFLFIIVYVYKDNLSIDFKTFKEKYVFKRKVCEIVKYSVAIFVATAIYGIVVSFFVPNYAGSDNSTAIISLFEISTIYTLFKILIFATVAEELVFKESLSSVVNNKFAFVIISSLIYATMNIIYSDLSNQYLIINLISYFLASLVLAIAYVKNDNNIFLVILIKFCYNLIPTLLLIFGVL